MGRRERALELAMRINALRQELTRAEAEFNRLLPDDETTQPLPLPPVAEPHVNGTAGSLTDRMIAHLDRNARRDFTAGDIVTALSLAEGRINTVRTTLDRLYKAGRIRRPTTGRYAALERLQAGA